MIMNLLTITNINRTASLVKVKKKMVSTLSTNTHCLKDRFPIVINHSVSEDFFNKKFSH